MDSYAQEDQTHPDSSELLVLVNEDWHGPNRHEEDPVSVISSLFRLTRLCRMSPYYV